MGAALLPADASNLYVEDFSRHIRHRGVPQALDGLRSGEARLVRAGFRQFEIDMMVPSMGPSIRGLTFSASSTGLPLEVGVLKG